MVDTPKPRVIERKPCDQVRLKPTQKLISVFALLGISVLIGLVFMIVVFFGERLEIVPFFGIIYMESLTEGENWITFYSFFILAIFLGILVIWILYRYYREKNCSEIDEPIDVMEDM